MSPFCCSLAGCLGARTALVRQRRARAQWDGEGGGVQRCAIAARRSRTSRCGCAARRYRYGGATLDGFDCSGLVFYAHRQLGLARAAHLARPGRRKPTSIKPRKLQRGDLVFFKIGSRKVNHVGIYIGKHRFVHAPGAGKPVTINSLDDEFYADDFFSAGRFWNRLPH